MQMRWQAARSLQEEAKKAEAAEKRASEARRKAAEKRKAAQAKQVSVSDLSQSYHPHNRSQTHSAMDSQTRMRA